MRRPLVGKMLTWLWSQHLLADIHTMLYYVAAKLLQHACCLVHHLRESSAIVRAPANALPERCTNECVQTWCCSVIARCPVPAISTCKMSSGHHQQPCCPNCTGYTGPNSGHQTVASYICLLGAWQKVSAYTETQAST
jgi:hypothetical protein